MNKRQKKKVVIGALSWCEAAIIALLVCLYLLPTAVYADNFHDLIVNGELNAVRKRIAHDVVLVNMADGLGRSPLHLAVISGDLAMVNVLIKAGADVNAIDRLKALTPLHYAAFHNYPKIMLFLLARAAQVAPRGVDHNTPLHFAAANGGTTTVEILLRHKAKPDVYNRKWQTPLHLAALAGFERHTFPAASQKEQDYLLVAKLLLQAGASFDTNDIWSNKPETIAWKNVIHTSFPQEFSRIVDSFRRAR